MSSFLHYITSCHLKSMHLKTAQFSHKNLQNNSHSLNVYVFMLGHIRSYLRVRADSKLDTPNPRSMKVSRSIHKEGHWPIFSGKLGKTLILILRWFPIPQVGLKLTVQQKKTGLCSQVMRLQYTLGHKDHNASPQSWVFFFVVVVRFFLKQGYWLVLNFTKFPAQVFKNLRVQA